MREGVVNLLKPPGMSSSDAVTDIRHIFGVKRAGHAGTLDPGAAGVLPVCLGRATRLFDYLVDKRKEYTAEIAFGASTDTQDSYGRVTERSDKTVAADTLRAALPGFTGALRQTAPIYSALNQGGKKLYQLAREGGEIERKVREINVYGLELLRQTGKNRFLLRIDCSRGTYVRTLCYDIGQSIGVPAHMSFLLRTRSGEFDIGRARTMAELRELGARGGLEEAVIPAEKALEHLGEVRMVLDEKGERFLRHGAEVVFPGVERLGADTPFRAYCNGRFVGIGISGGGAVHICVLLGGAEVE